MNDVHRAPVVLIMFNRPQMSARVMRDLKAADDAQERDLFVFIDGPRNEAERLKCEEVVHTVESFRRDFKKMQIICRTRNVGCRDNIIDAVGTVMKRYGSAIVIEDDILISRTFLTFMDQALAFYKDDKRIWCVNGFRNLGIRVPRDYEGDVYLDARNWSWGWAGWYDRWAQVDFDLSYWPSIANDPAIREKVDANGIELWGMAEGVVKGRLNTWDIQCTMHMALYGLYAVESRYPLSKSVGFGGDSTHCTGGNPELMAAKYYNVVPRLVANMKPDKRILRQLRYATADWRILPRITRKLKRMVISLHKNQLMPSDL